MTDTEISEENMLKYITAIANKKHVRLNPDQKVVENVVRGLVRNHGKYGNRFCPCRIVTGDEETDRFNICPCADMEKEVNVNGHCKCRLYFKEEQK